MEGNYLEEYVSLEKLELELEKERETILKRDIKIFNAITELNKKVENIAEEKAIMRNVLLEQMEKANIKKYENDLLTITYVAPTVRVGVDSDKLKEKYEAVYLDCLKETPVKSSLRIKIKDE